MKTLIVDDIKENLYLLLTLLKGSGYEVVAAENGVEALTKLKEESIDLIISDILMPKMDGFQLCRVCKKDHNLKKIPFIFYTATYTDKKDEEFALSLGAVRFIVKPQEPETLLKIVNEVMDKHKEKVPLVPQEEEEKYLSRYNERLVQKLDKKIFDLEKTNKVLQEKEEKIYNLSQFQENIIHNANVWINVLDEKTNVMMWNEAAEKMSGYSATEVIGHDKIWEWLYPDENYRMKITAKTSAIIEKGEEVEDYETKISCKDGKAKIISWNSRNLTNPQGKIIGSVSLGRDITARKQAEERLKKTMDETIETMSKIIEAKDPYTAGHQLRVSQLAVAIAAELNLSQDQLEGIRVSSLIHDIGKISLPTETLSKPTKLTDLEFSLIKGHSQMGYDILKSIDFNYPVANIVLQHHERLNGSGYPQGLEGDNILLEAKIIGVADVVEAMSSHRPYRPALGMDQALKEISQNRNILYDAEVTDACLKLFKGEEFKFEL